jgi:hypothetical protein
MRSFVTCTLIKVIKSGRMRWIWHVASVGEMRNTDKVLIRKAEGKRSLRIPRSRMEDNIRMDLREIGWEGVDWIRLVQDGDQ